MESAKDDITQQEKMQKKRQREISINQESYKIEEEIVAAHHFRIWGQEIKLAGEDDNGHLMLYFTNNFGPKKPWHHRDLSFLQMTRTFGRIIKSQSVGYMYISMSKRHRQFLKDFISTSGNINSDIDIRKDSSFEFLNRDMIWLSKLLSASKRMYTGHPFT